MAEGIDDGGVAVAVAGVGGRPLPLGAGVHRAYAARRNDAVFLATTRHALGLPLLGSFHEEHSHATLHLLHEPADGATAAMVRGARSLVLVDDEMSTGRTLVNLARALEAAGLTVLDLPVLTDVDHFPDALAVAELCPPDSRMRRVVAEVAATLPD